MNFVFKPSDNVLKEIIKYYEPLKKEKKPDYSVMQANDADTTITIYESGKVMFQGISADIDAYRWFEEEKVLNNRDIFKELKDKKPPLEKPKQEQSVLHYDSSIGSDEVGTGDYFGPIVVTAAYVTKEDDKLLNELKITDSKLINDELIKQMAPILIKKVPHVTYVLNNNEYNNLSSTNLNQIKAILHNKVIYTLIQKTKLKNVDIIIDEFVNEKKYFEHLKDSSNIVRSIKFIQKADLKVKSVSVAATIARYTFLKEMEKLSIMVNEKIPLGAGVKVDEFGKRLVAKCGKEKLKEIAKYNYKNTKKILES